MVAALTSLREVWSPKASEITERVRTSRFAREVIGPRIARPLAGWLEETFAEDADEHRPVVAEPTTTRLPEVSAPEVSVPEVSAPEASAQEARDTRARHGAARTKDVLAGLKDGIKNHNLVVVAAGIAFWGLLAIPAVLFATLSVAGLVLDPATVKDEVNNNLGGLPEEARTIIGDQLENVSAGSTGGLIAGLVVGLVLALWTTSGAMAKMMSTLNTIYGTTEHRKFWVLRGIALLLTVGGIVFISGAVFLLAAMPALLGEIDAVGDSAATLPPRAAIADHTGKIRK